MIQAALVAYLKANLSVTRIYPQVAPQGATLPVLVVDQTGSTRARHYSGGASGGTATGMIDTDFEISIWALNAYAASILALELIGLLENFRGRWTDASLSPPVVHAIADIEITGETQGFDAATEHYDHSVFISIAHG